MGVVGGEGEGRAVYPPLHKYSRDHNRVGLRRLVIKRRRQVDDLAGDGELHRIYEAIRKSVIVSISGR